MKILLLLSLVKSFAIIESEKKELYNLLLNYINSVKKKDNVLQPSKKAYDDIMVFFEKKNISVRQYVTLLEELKLIKLNMMKDTNINNQNEENNTVKNNPLFKLFLSIFFRKKILSSYKRDIENKIENFIKTIDKK